MHTDLLDRFEEPTRNFTTQHPLFSSVDPYEIPSATYKAGRQFSPTRELEILPSLRQAVWGLPTMVDSSVVMIPECPLPGGVPDLVVIMAKKERLAARLHSGIRPILAEQEARLVAACGPKRGASLERLKNVTGLSELQTKRLLSRLVGCGALNRDGSRWRRDEVLSPIGRIYALEAKASDWKAGFFQSMRYASYADASALALGRISSRVATEASEVAKRSGVGLYMDGAWHHRPRTRFLPIERRFWVSEHVIAALTGI